MTKVYFIFSRLLHPPTPEIKISYVEVASNTAKNPELWILGSKSIYIQFFSFLISLEERKQKHLFASVSPETWKKQLSIVLGHSSKTVPSVHWPILSSKKIRLTYFLYLLFKGSSPLLVSTLFPVLCYCNNTATISTGYNCGTNS